MTFWVQHGYGKGDKIQLLCDSERPPAGIIMSPSSEPLARLVETSHHARSNHLTVLLDPESYVYTINGADGKKHSENGLDFGSMHWSDSPGRLEEIVAGVVEVNDELETDAVITPAPYQSTFGDVWAAMPIQLTRATIEATDKPVFASIVVNSTAFAEWARVEEWLDAFTSVEADGVYLIVGWESSGTYPNAWDPALLQNIFRFVYRLTVLNRYELVWAYSDIAGAVGLAAGADGFASGWFQTLRLWTSQKWLPRSGGRQSQPRVLSVPLLSPLRASGEADVAAASRLGPATLPDGDVRAKVLADSWGLSDSWNQHMAGLAEIGEQITEFDDDPEARVEPTLDRIDGAIALFDDLRTEGVALEGIHRTRLDSLRRALAGFGSEEGLL